MTTLAVISLVTAATGIAFGFFLRWIGDRSAAR
jgi:hypothetical protein